ncbi:RHS repeat-associated core domain-containing protein [Dokdonella sp.]|uniref:RHS repeat-associated core domain-containing protein n=1 Tax=Dokdonella sp. TaxID=2291710 RepID=UPI001B0190E9|nr:RHS repeat-associated core domain-containing protein [Dokdonella sp.]MBO9664191.1 HNH endonuclease [Dokdonella sp.]
MIRRSTSVALRVLRVALLSAALVGACGIAAKPKASRPAAAKLSAQKPASMPRVSPVVADLLAGVDARASVAQALSELAPSSPRKVAPGDGAFAGYVTALTRVGQGLDAARRGAAANATPALRQAIDAAQAERLLVDARLEAVGAEIAAKSLPALARQRWESHRAALTAMMDSLDRDLATLQTQLAGGRPPGSAGPGDLPERLKQSAGAVRVFGANPLPVHRPHLPARAPSTAPAIAPSYADRSREVEPVAEDLGSSDEAPQSTAVLSKAQSLGYDYTRILDFVRSQVRTQWYAGAQKGADGTLATLAGNDVDQASLLIALLRASGAPARYVRGVVEVPAADLAASLGVHVDEVGRALTVAGVANEPVIAGGRVGAYRIEHVFVSARVPFSAYRGTSAERSGATWIPLLPALKPHVLVPASGIVAQASIDVGALVDGYLEEAQTVSPLAQLEARVNAYLNTLPPPQSLDEQLGRHDVAAPALQVLPAGPPVPIRAVTGEFAVLPDELRQRVSIRVRAGGEETAAMALERDVPVSALRGRRVTLSYEPASIDDGAIADGYGGLGSTPPYLIKLRVVLSVDGVPLVHGTAAVDAGTSLRLEVTFAGPGGEVDYAQQLIAGGYDALVFDVQGEAPALQGDDVSLPGDSEPPAAKLLANLGARYLAAWNAEDEALARLLGVTPLRPFPSLLLVTSQYRVDRIDGTVDALAWQGVALDAGLRPVEPVAQGEDAGVEADWTRMSALQGSVLEHAVFEQQWAVDSVSADNGLAQARAAGTPILHLAPGADTAALNQPAEVVAAVRGWLDRGYGVDIPRDPVLVQHWRGAVWRVENAASGEAGYFIAGALAGGATAMPPELWYFQDLAELLANPYAQQPNEDPDAAVAISLDASTQNQKGVADTDLERPLRAALRDVNGRPVQGGTVVFAVTEGSPKLIDPNGQRVSQLSVLTDRRGVAEARVHLGEKAGDFGYYVLEPSMTYPQWVGLGQVSVTAPNDHGVLYAGEQFRMGTWPGEPGKIDFGLVSGDWMNPGVSYQAMAATVTDAHDNEISNVHLSIGVSTAYGQSPPACVDEAPGPMFPAALFAPGQCPAGAYMLTGNTCAGGSLDVISRPAGAPFNVVPPSAALATVTVTFNAGSASNSVKLYTDDSFYQQLACQHDNALAFLGWATTPPVGQVPLLGQFLAPIDAARPGEVFPVTRRGDIVRGRIRRSSPPTVEWTPVNDAQITFALTNASGENLRNIGGGSYLWEMRAGATPGQIRGNVWAYIPPENRRFALQLLSPNADQPGGDGILHGWVVDPAAPQVDPPIVPLTPFNASDAAIRITANFRPSDYRAAPLNLQLLADEEVVVDCPVPLGDAAMFCKADRGLRIEPDRRYVARTVLNDGTPYRMVSGDTEVHFGQGLIAGYGVVPVSSDPGANPPAPPLDPLQVAALIGGRYPQRIKMTTDLDVATQYVCPIGESFAFMLAQDAHVTLKFLRLDSSGNPSPISAWTPLDDEAMTQGVHTLALSPQELRFGEYAYELSAVGADGSTEVRRGRASNVLNRHDSLPLAHPIVKGVDVFSGNATISEQDIALGGRGPGIKLTRTYASHQGGQRGVLGYGWTTELDGQVRATGCNERIVSGSAGQGMTFVPDYVDATGAQVFKPLHGYHATLVQRQGEYDLYAKDGTRYHYGQFDPTGPRLNLVVDPNGNQVDYLYETQGGVPRVAHVRDGAGRQIDLVYQTLSFTQTFGDITVHDSALLLTQAKGPLGLIIDYTYDADGNLQRVQRSDGSGSGRAQSYVYHDYGGLISGSPTGDPLYFHFGYRLEEAANALNNAKRSYVYDLQWSGVDTPDGILYVPEQRVKKLTEPDGGETAFVYDGVRGLSPVGSTVTDARGHPTTYALNRYGAAERVTDAVGTTQTEWDFAHLLPHRVTDAENTVTTYVYDANGNTLSEEIQHASGTQSRSWTYRAAEEFDPPYVRNRPGTYTDPRGIVATYTYDAHGNRRSVERGGVTERDDYQANGDRITHTDGTGKIWRYGYDDYGTPSTVEDPARNTRTTTYDARGRKIADTDPNGNTTKTRYDADDRPLEITYPAVAAGTGKRVFAYDDVADRSTETNPRDTQTVSAYDAMGRLVGVTTPAGTRSLHYDRNGNKLDESDFAGGVTRYEYDEANRLTYKRESEGRTTRYEYDRLGHVVRETVGEGDTAAGSARVTEYVYADPAYRRTDVRRRLTGPDGDTWAVEHTGYDGNGNAVLTRDALNRETTREYDQRDRLRVQREPLGRTTTIAYDDADRKTKETLANVGGSGDQVREWSYDDAGRVRATVDAEGARRTTEYDRNGNVTLGRDGNGGTVISTYDALNRLLTQSGPETGQATAYGYDLNGNRTREVWANGRTITHVYDPLDRRTDSSDEEGRFEHLTYRPDGEIETRTDANGRVTTDHYDGLRRLVRQELPRVDGTPRELKMRYDVHGDVVGETDAGNHETIHDYDSLGRRTSTRLPDVDGASATHTTAYDLVGNVKSQTDARGNTTTFEVDELNRRVLQTDPADGSGEVHTQSWRYDAAGNEVEHTDRRGIATLTSYDRMNRVTGRMRDLLMLETLTRDAEGNVLTSLDAKRRLTTDTYDRANRRLSETRPLDAKRSWTYFPLGDVKSETDADGRTTTYTYTPRRYLATQTNAAGETTTHTYDGEGHRLTTERPLGENSTWHYAYDAADRLRTVTDPERNVTTYGYDADGNRTSIEDANHHVTTFGYDARHRLRSRNYPSVGGVAAVHAWTYDADGNPAVETTPNGDAIATTYDALGRLARATYANAQPGAVSATDYRYDGNGNQVTLTEQVQGGAPRSETRRYDRFDRLERVADVLGRSVDTGYDEVGNRTSLIDADGRTTVWTYDALNRNRTVAVPGQGTTNLDYFPSGKLQLVTRPDGSTSETGYDLAGRIESIAHAKAGVAIARLHYRYDLNGNRVEQKESNGAATANGEETTTYVYDLADRLTEITEADPAGGAARHAVYRLDAVGNRIEETITAGGGQTISHSTLAYDARDRLTNRDDATTGTQAVLGYDANGNATEQTIGGTTRTFGYDPRNRLMTLEQPGAPPLTFDYDSQGQRLRKAQGGAETRYQYDDGSLLAETNAIGNGLARYHYGAGQLISRTELGTTPTQRHYLLDALKTPIVLLTQDGAISARTSYDAWGEVRRQQGSGGATVEPDRTRPIADLANTDNQPIGFTGYVKDAESGLYYAKARYYDPVIARFVAEDPEAGDPMQPPSLHRYLYAYANPTVYTDPYGRCPLESFRCGLETSVAFAPNEKARETAKGVLAHYDAQMQARADPVATGIAHSFINATRSLTQLAGDALYTIPEALLPDSLDAGSRVRLGAFFVGMGNLIAHPIDTIGQNYAATLDEASSLRQSGNEFAARAKATEANTDMVSLAFGGPGLARGVTRLGTRLAPSALRASLPEAQQARNALQGALRAVENPSGGGPDLRPVSPVTPGYNLERRLELIADSEFDALNRTPKEPVPSGSTYQERFNQTPANNGWWSGERGESTFYSSDPGVKSITRDRGVGYADARPNFSPYAAAEVDIPNMTINRRANFSQADQVLADQMGVPKREVTRWREENKYTWHEDDTTRMQLVPTDINGKHGHLGGIGELKRQKQP